SAPRRTAPHATWRAIGARRATRAMGSCSIEEREVMARLPHDGVGDRGFAAVEMHGEDQFVAAALLPHDRLRRAARDGDEIALVVHAVRAVGLSRDALALRELDVQPIGGCRR